jgi:thioredoxin-related protein
MTSLLTVILALVVPAVAGADEIGWRTRLDAARKEAVGENRPMLLEFWAAWCAPCKYMDAEVYSDPRVVEAMKKVLPVRLDVDVEESLSRKYEVQGIPTLIFTDSYGNELFRFQGLLEVDVALQLLMELPADVTRINAFSEALGKNKNDFAALQGLARELRQASLFRASNDYYRRALGTREARASTAARAGILREIGRNHEALKEFDEAKKAFRDAERLERQ